MGLPPRKAPESTISRIVLFLLLMLAGRCEDVGRSGFDGGGAKGLRGRPYPTGRRTEVQSVRSLGLHAGLRRECQGERYGRVKFDMARWHICWNAQGEGGTACLCAPRPACFGRQAPACAGPSFEGEGKGGATTELQNFACFFFEMPMHCFLPYNSTVHSCVLRTYV